MCKNFVNLSASVIELLLKTKNSKLISKLKKNYFPIIISNTFYGSNDKSNDSNAPLHIFVNCFYGRLYLNWQYRFLYQF